MISAFVRDLLSGSSHDAGASPLARKLLSSAPDGLSLRPHARHNRAGKQFPRSQFRGGLLLFDALKRQLGLRLEKQKHLFPMVVLDHINRKPTDN
jgi:uncharacterized protein (TIGR03435 family)